MNLNAMLTQWKMAKRHGYQQEFLVEIVLSRVARFLQCRVLGRHQVKMDSHGACYKCGKAVR